MRLRFVRAMTQFSILVRTTMGWPRAVAEKTRFPILDLLVRCPVVLPGRFGGEEIAESSPRIRDGVSDGRPLKRALTSPPPSILRLEIGPTPAVQRRGAHGEFYHSTLLWTRAASAATA
jgi:hypothetical protein